MISDISIAFIVLISYHESMGRSSNCFEYFSFDTVEVEPEMVVEEEGQEMQLDSSHSCL